MKKIVIARLSVQKQNIEQFLEKAKIMVQKSNAEKGCLTYRLFQEIDASAEFIFYETYINQEAVDIHNTSEHFKEFLSFASSILTKEPSIEIF